MNECVMADIVLRSCCWQTGEGCHSSVTRAHSVSSRSAAVSTMGVRHPLCRWPHRRVSASVQILEYAFGRNLWALGVLDGLRAVRGLFMALGPQGGLILNELYVRQRYLP